MLYCKQLCALRKLKKAIFKAFHIFYIIFIKLFLYLFLENNMIKWKVNFI